MRLILILIVTFMSYESLAALNFKELSDHIMKRSCGENLGSPPVMVVVGLGNVGYHGTRHNYGADLVDAIANSQIVHRAEVPEEWRQFQAKDEEEALEYIRFSAASSPYRQGLTVHYRIGAGYAVPTPESELNQFVFFRPFYDINESGYAVTDLLKQSLLKPENLIVVVDDLTLARNQIVVSMGKANGEGDGHNGLKSLNKELGTGAYVRIRVGVSNPKTEKSDVDRTTWVLGQVPEEDRSRLFSESRLKDFRALLLNLQQRVAEPEPNFKQKLVAQGRLIEKSLNKKD